jgi:membrane-associated phospholipid phosphatase
LFSLVDVRVRASARRSRSELNDDLGAVFEKFGDGSYGLGLLGLYGGLCWLRDSDYGARTASLGVQAFVAANAAGSLVKLSAGRARPYAGEGRGSFKPFYLNSSHTSFPSGHTTSAFAIASVISGRCVADWVKVSAYTLAAGTALQRVYDDKHWFSDTVIGAALGAAVGRYVVARSNSGGDGALLLPVYAPGYSGAVLAAKFR